MTGHHRGLKRKLRAGYRAVSRTSHVAMRFLSSSVVSHTFCALCVHSKFGHHPHLLGYLYAKFRFFCSLHCWASPWRKIAYSITHSITQLIWRARNRSFRFGIPLPAFLRKYHQQSRLPVVHLTTSQAQLWTTAVNVALTLSLQLYYISWQHTSSASQCWRSQR